MNTTRQEEILEALTAAHRMMKHMITLIRVQIDILYPAADGMQFEFLDKAIGYMSKYPGLVHHPAEELIFARLLRYSPQTRQLCDHLTEQHNVFSNEEAAMLENLPRARIGDDEACRHIKEIGLTYCAQHVSHIDDEEERALPEAADWLQASDWREIGEKTNFAIDPLSDPKAVARHASIYDFIMATGAAATGH